MILNLIVYSLADSGADFYTCPITQTTLSVQDDLITVKGMIFFTGSLYLDIKSKIIITILANRSVKPRPVTSHSIPSLLSLFQVSQCYNECYNNDSLYLYCHILE